MVSISLLQLYWNNETISVWSSRDHMYNYIILNYLCFKMKFPRDGHFLLVLLGYEVLCCHGNSIHYNTNHWQ